MPMVLKETNVRINTSHEALDFEVKKYHKSLKT